MTALTKNELEEVIEALEILEKKYNKYFERKSVTREEYWNSNFDFSDFLIDNDINPIDENIFKLQIQSEFLNQQIISETFQDHQERQDPCP